MIFIIGDIVRLLDGSYDEVIGFKGDVPITGKRAKADYRSMDIIGHSWRNYYRESDIAVTLYVL